MDERLSVRGVSKSFGATRALEGVELIARPGEVHAVVGENGAGKSTLMKILAGALSPDAGAILLDGSPFRPSSPAEARALGVSMVSQELAVCSHLSVVDNVMLGREPSKLGVLDRAEMKRQAAAALDLVAGKASARWVEDDTLVGQLPVASQQLVEIARALVGRAGCRVLILDEPTSSLGREDAERLFTVIRGLCEEGIAVLYISHFLEEVRRIADRYTVLRDGITTGTGEVGAVTLSDIVQLMAGRRIEQLFSRSEREPGEEVLSLSELAGEPLPKSASLSLRRGEVLGIAGLVGAGRTELLRAVFGLAPVRGGTIRVKSWVGPASPARRWSQGVGVLSEDRKGEGLASALSVMDNLTLSRLPAGPLGALLPSRQRKAASRWIDELGIKVREPTQPVSDLSGGNQQKVALARLLHHDVDVLLLDEPTRGIDVGSKAQIYALVDRLACEGKAVLMVSSYLPELLGVCDRICVMRRGVLGAPRGVAAWSEQTLLEEATGAVA